MNPLFKKLSSRARSVLNLDQLVSMRQKQASRLEVMKASDLFPFEDLNRIVESIQDLDTRIKNRKEHLESEARKEMQKIAASLNLVVNS